MTYTKETTPRTDSMPTPITRQEILLSEILKQLQAGGGSATNGQIIFDISQLTTTRASIIQKIEIVPYVQE